jgi:hypothetical protein
MSLDDPQHGVITPRNDPSALRHRHPDRSSLRRIALDQTVVKGKPQAPVQHDERHPRRSRANPRLQTNEPATNLRRPDRTRLPLAKRRQHMKPQRPLIRDPRRRINRPRPQPPLQHDLEPHAARPRRNVLAPPNVRLHLRPVLVRPSPTTERLRHLLPRRIQPNRQPPLPPPPPPLIPLPLGAPVGLLHCCSPLVLGKRHALTPPVNQQPVSTDER